MKILAVRLAEVGCFSGAVAVEGLGDGLNVLVGANEAGKSTILAALRMAFEQSHKADKQQVRALRPYSGGAPLVEVDFALGAHIWRIRKRYLAATMAELQNMTTGEISRGADAEENLTQLLARTAGGRSSIKLLWTSQADALTPIAPDADAAAYLKAAISQEIEVTVGGSEARQVRAAVRFELERYVTAQRAQPRGEFDALIKLKRKLESDLALAVARRDAALVRLDRLSVLKAQEEELCDPARISARADASTKATAAAAAARDALQKQRAAADAVSGAESRLALARSRREALDDDLKRLAALTAEAVLDQDLSRDLATSLADVEARVTDARDARNIARNALAEADRELKAAREAERREEAQRRLSGLDQTLAAADEAMRAGLELKSQLDAVRVTPDLLRTIRSEDDALRRLEDRLAAAAPRLTIAYAPGAEGRITQNGATLAGGAHLVDRPLVLEIAGIGTIEIAPGVSDDAATAQDALARHRVTLAGLFAEAGAASLADAERQLTQRQQLEQEIGEARARLGALLPAGGLAKLKGEIDALAASVSEGDGEAVRPRADIERDIDAIRQDLIKAESADEAAQRAFAVEREASVRHAATSADRAKRLDEVELRLPAPAARHALALELQEAASVCERALHAAVREHTAWREQAPDHDQLQALEASAQHAANAVSTENRQREELHRSVASLEGELRADRNDEVEARVAELQGALDAATNRLARMEDDVAALQLLDSELRAEEMRSQDQYLRPISERLAPYVDLVFPGADITVAENFAPASLRRANDREAIAALSEGTQEQLAVMVRLAFGRLMADTGSAVPVILDDALVYSDDERILRMFAALITAARHHQLIVLTCRSRTFSSLDGHRLKIAPWQPDAQSSDRHLLSASA